MVFQLDSAFQTTALRPDCGFDIDLAAAHIFYQIIKIIIGLTESNAASSLRKSCYTFDMIIGIEASRANKAKKTGVEWYAWHVIQELKKLTKEDGNSWILYTNKILEGGLEVLPPNWFEVRAKWPLKYGWTQLRLSWELLRRKADVLYLPGSTLPRYTPEHTVVTVHDVGFHHLPQLYKKRQVHIHEAAMNEIKNRVQRIITVSEYSKQQISESYGIDPSRIRVTFNGVDHKLYRPLTDIAAIENTLRRYNLSKPFFITIGRLEAKKNILNLIRAFDSFKTQHGVGDPHKLVLVGAPGFGYEEIKRAIKSSKYQSDIFELGYVSELDLPALLNAADALIHPSWYEGFGIPPLMAMACGCAVISSNATSLPEVIGPDAGLYFKPGESEQLCAAMSRLVSESGLKEQLKSSGVTRAAKYTWENTAKLTLPALLEW
ncbi:glycosyltransferase family 4 protein [Patescibacteria group bacterium]|nr:glycosyltransferase family 4 protein [Patescibacteria group bacterium]